MLTPALRKAFSAKDLQQDESVNDIYLVSRSTL